MSGPEQGRGRLALVTGGAGFIGSHLVDALLARGWSVRVLDDLSSGRRENLAAAMGRIDFVEGDIRDGGTLARAVAGAHLVFHQAAIPSVTRSIDDPVCTHGVNTRATLDLLEQARRAGVARLVFAASSAIYGEPESLPIAETSPARPLSPYALQKHASELYCRLFTDLYGFETVSLRYFNVYGPRQNPESDYAAVIPLFLDACVNEKPARIFGDGDQTRDFVFIDDVVRANLLAATAPAAVGKAINVAGRDAIGIKGLFALIRELAGSSVSPTHAPARKGEVRDSLADVSAAAELLDFRPEVDLQEGLRRTIEGNRNGCGGGGRA